MTPTVIGRLPLPPSGAERSEGPLRTTTVIIGWWLLMPVNAEKREGRAFEHASDARRC